MNSTTVRRSSHRSLLRPTWPTLLLATLLFVPLGGCGRWWQADQLFGSDEVRGSGQADAVLQLRAALAVSSDLTKQTNVARIADTFIGDCSRIAIIVTVYVNHGLGPDTAAAAAGDGWHVTAPVPSTPSIVVIGATDRKLHVVTNSLSPMAQLKWEHMELTYMDYLSWDADTRYLGLGMEHFSREEWVTAQDLVAGLFACTLEPNEGASFDGTFVTWVRVWDGKQRKEVVLVEATYPDWARTPGPPEGSRRFMELVFRLLAHADLAQFHLADKVPIP